MLCGELVNRIRSFSPVMGTMLVEVNTPGIGAIAEAAGLDFVIFDMEHSGFAWDSIRSAMAYCRGLRIGPLVRVPRGQSDYVSRALDVGAAGIMVPFVESEEQARAIVAAAKYPPEGRRGVISGAAHDDFRGGNTADMLARANRDTLILAQVKTATGAEEAAGIASVRGVDVLFVGHYDLSCSLGVPGEFGHPSVRAAVDKVLEGAAVAGKPVGRMAFSLEEMEEAVADGFTVIAYQTDIGLLREGYRRAADHLGRRIRRG